MTPGGLAFRQMAVALLFIALAATACLMPMQSDTYWHLRAGEDIWRTGRVALVESYSFTAAGRPFLNHEWLWEVAAYLCFTAGGPPLLTLASAAMAVGACAIVYRLMTGPTLVRFVLMLAALPLVSGVWAVRPQVASLLLLATLAWLLVHQRHLAIPPLFVLWANVHGGVALGGWVLLVVTAFAAFAAFTAIGPRRRALTLLAVTGLSGLGTAVTPLGFRMWTTVVEMVTTAQETQVIEWQPAYPTTIAEIAFWLLAIAFVVLTIRRWWTATTWSDRALIVAALALLPLAALSVRNIAPFLLLAMPAASRLVGQRLIGPARPASADHPRLNLALVATCAVVLTVGVGVAWAQPHPRLGWNPMRPEAAAAVAGCPGQVWNGYNEGGFLIWFVREKPVFVDSRYFPYPREIVACTGEGDDPAAEAALFSRLGIACAALPPSSSAAAYLQSLGWRPRYADPQWLVLQRPNAPAP